jgi:hypothetical protein
MARAAHRARRRGRIARDSRRSWWEAADRVFAPGNLYLGVRDEVMERLYKARGAIGFTVLLITAIHFRGARGVSRTFEDWAGSLVTLTVAGFAGVLLAGAALVVVSFPGRRSAAALQLRWPLLAFAALAGLILLTFGPLFLVKDVHWPKHGSWQEGISIIASIPLFLGGLAFLCRALYFMAVGVCRAADGHPLLPPLVAPLAATACAVQSLVFGAKDADGMPAGLHIALVACGPLSIGVLSCVEILRLRRNPLFPFRGGPPRLDAELQPATQWQRAWTGGGRGDWTP